MGLTTAHKRQMQLHFDMRAKERIGIETNRHEAREHLELIKKLNSVKIRAGEHRAWYYIPYNGIFCWILVDFSANRIVTVLADNPKEIPENQIIRVKKYAGKKKAPWNKKEAQGV